MPEFSLQNRKDLIRRKVEIIQKESGRDDIYIRNFVKRHPDILLKSMGSLEAKISYFQRNLNRQLKQEKSFPLVLHYNYNQVIRPRGDILLEKVKYFDFQNAFHLSDEQFCEEWGVDPADLE